MCLKINPMILVEKFALILRAEKRGTVYKLLLNIKEQDFWAPPNYFPVFEKTSAKIFSRKKNKQTNCCQLPVIEGATLNPLGGVGIPTVVWFPWNNSVSCFVLHLLRELAKMRTEKDLWFQLHRHSPLSQKERMPAATYLGKQYKVITLQDLFCFLTPTFLIHDKANRCKKPSTFFLVSFKMACCGEGNGNPLQYSRLENPMDRGDW